MNVLAGNKYDLLLRDHARYAPLAVENGKRLWVSLPVLLYQRDENQHLSRGWRFKQPPLAFVDAVLLLPNYVVHALYFHDAMQ